MGGLQLTDLMILVAVIGVVALVLILGGGKRKDLRRQIARLQQRKGGVKAQTSESLRRKAEEPKGLLEMLARPLPDFKKLGDQLERAGRTTTPKQFVMRRLLTVLAFVLGAALLNKSLLLGLCLGIILGVWVPFKWMQRQITQRSKAFLRLFPDGIDLIVRGLRSGLPVSESLVLVSHEVPDPVGGVFTNIANTMKLGVPLEKALLETARKLDMTEFNFFTTSIILQRETGGNLSEILNNLSEVLRQRFIMRMKIKALSSEARASAIIIGCLPFFVFIMVSIISPKYITPLYQDYRGNIAMGIAAGMMLSGGYIMRRMTQFEI